MRILQVVTLVSPVGEYGGPVSVARNQSRQLKQAGHDVTITAAVRGYRCPPTELDGVPVRLFPARTVVPGTGFAGIGAPGMVRWLRRCGRDFDLVHLHLGRDLVGLPAAMSVHRMNVQYVVQTHGMIVPSAHPLSGPLDALCTRRVLRGAGAVFSLTHDERTALSAVAGDRLRHVSLSNGVPRQPDVESHSGTPQVTFVARLHQRKRPVAFVEMAHRLLAAGVEARFTLVGPDEGEGEKVRRAIGGEDRIRWVGARGHDQVMEFLRRSAMFVLPSVREPYPMAVLEAMSLGVPVVIGQDCGLAPLVERHGCGLVVQPTVPQLVTAVRRILEDQDLAATMSTRARHAVARECDMSAVGERLLSTYSTVVGGSA